MSILFSDKYPVVVLAFRVRNRGSIWLDGNPAGRIYVEKHEMEQQVGDMIDEGRLTLDPEGRRKPLLVSVRGSGGFYAAVLEDPEEAEREAETRRPWSTRSPQPCMQPVTGYDEERNAIQLIEDNRFHDFVELLAVYKPKTVEGPAGSDGKAIHLLTRSTLAAEKVEHEEHGPKGRDARTLVLVDRGVSMADPWSLWEQYPKIKVARFLANAVAASHPNAAIFSFGETLRRERSPDDAEPLDEETRLDAALRQVSLFEPERLVILTDGKPVRVYGFDADEGCEEAVASLDALARSGTQTLIFTLGRNGEMERFYSRLRHTPGARVVPLSIGGDVVRMMHELADWV
jgi:hypothetical protein